MNRTVWGDVRAAMAARSAALLATGRSMNPLVGKPHQCPCRSPARVARCLGGDRMPRAAACEWWRQGTESYEILAKWMTPTISPGSSAAA
jgi:hypothetical protein